jgi:hypothetical protein
MVQKSLSICGIVLISSKLRSWKKLFLNLILLFSRPAGPYKLPFEHVFVNALVDYSRFLRLAEDENEEDPKKMVDKLQAISANASVHDDDSISPTPRNPVEYLDDDGMIASSQIMDSSKVISTETNPDKSIAESIVIDDDDH